MSKYIYCNGKIYNNKNNNLHILSQQDLVGDFDTKNEYRLVEYLYNDPHCKRILEHINLYLEFDSFEDLVEAGDLVNVQYTRGVDCFRSVSIVNKDLPIVPFRLEGCGILQFDDICEIWKRLGNTFIRVCHKENNEWVID